MIRCVADWSLRADTLSPEDGLHEAGAPFHQGSPHDLLKTAR
jgi:hypothetical protein